MEQNLSPAPAAVRARQTQLAINGLLLVLSLLGFVQVLHLKGAGDVAPWIMPLSALGLIAVLSAGSLIAAMLVPDRSEPVGAATGVGRMAMGFMIVVIAVVMISMTGLTLSSVAMLGVLTWLLGERRPVVIGTACIVPPLIMFAIARFVLHVPWN